MLLEYQLDWIKIVDFLLIAKFWASPNNLYPTSTFNFKGKNPQKIQFIFHMDEASINLKFDIFSNLLVLVFNQFFHISMVD